MKCAKCNVVYPDSHKYCNRCGKKLIDELMMGELFTKKDEDFHEYKKGFKF
jgi:rRNA maturation endonuclease Nob1